MTMEDRMNAIEARMRTLEIKYDDLMKMCKELEARVEAIENKGKWTTTTIHRKA